MNFVVALAALSVLIGLSVFADRRFRELDRVPMQWGVGGTVNWTAPRRLALAFTPLLAAVVLTAVIVLPSDSPPVSTVLIPAVALIAAHALHIYLIGRSAKS